MSKKKKFKSINDITLADCQDMEPIVKALDYDIDKRVNDWVEVNDWKFTTTGNLPGEIKLYYSTENSQPQYTPSELLEMWTKIKKIVYGTGSYVEWVCSGYMEEEMLLNFLIFLGVDV